MFTEKMELSKVLKMNVEEIKNILTDEQYGTIMEDYNSFEKFVDDYKAKITEEGLEKCDMPYTYYLHENFSKMFEGIE